MQKNDLFDYGLYIYQQPEYFKFSIDSILIAEYVELKDNSYILDLCTGNAPIPMILSTKNKKIKIDALEIQKEVYELAYKSIHKNNLGSIINIINVDAKTYLNAKKYDIITCNPPYFKVSNSSILNTNLVKQIARHEVCIDIDDIISTVKNNLRDYGSFYLVHRCDRLFEICKKLNENNIGIRKITFIRTKEGTNLKIFLLKAQYKMKTDIKYFDLCIDGLKTYKDIFKGDN